MSAPFVEQNRMVPCGIPWGQWCQSLEEVFIEVWVPPGTRVQEIQCGLQSRHVELAVWGQEILKGKLFDSTQIVGPLLETEYAADPWVQGQMQRKHTLERSQKENPAFDFSGAEISGNYSKGGPDFSSLEKYKLPFFTTFHGALEDVANVKGMA
uniref:CS domain-containing protein n=1 Tax=Monodelphis domestica TaxID=13616 RepID=A0A5F8H1Z6_MONDO